MAVSLRLDDLVGVKVKLRRDEMLHAAMVGATRCIEDLVGAAQAAYGAPGDNDWQLDIQGALGEKVVAKHFGLYWSGALGDKSAKDVGGAQVRCSTSHDNSLIVHRPPPAERDSPDDPFILVTGKGPLFWIRGWLLGREAQRDIYWRTHFGPKQLQKPAFFVPAVDLRSIETLELPWRG